MSGFTTVAPRDETVGRKRAGKTDEPDASGRSINFRADAELAASLDDVAHVLKLDVSNLVRMIISENIYIYQMRAQEALSRRVKRQKPDDA